jgi:transcriptional regulator with GAF, ATPase, and Fis domain/tetratricopeptide (TPR) repeat protein
MKLPDLPDWQREVLAILEAFSQPVSVEMVRSLMSISHDEMAGIIRELAQIGWLSQTTDNMLDLASDLPPAIANEIRGINTPDRLSELADQIRDFGLYDQRNPDLLMDLLTRSGRIREMALFAYECAIKEIEDGNFKSAMEHQKKVLSHLRSLLGDPECDRVFILASLSLSDLVDRFQGWHEETLKILNQARAVCRRLGDKRHLALINLHMGRVYQLLHRPNDAFDVFTSGLNMVKALGDDDIITQASQFFGMYYFIQGMSKESAEHFEKAMTSDISREGQVLSMHIPTYLGSCTAFMGEFYRAIGVVDSNRRRAWLKSEYKVARWLRAHLGNILLMAGKKQEALIHLQKAEKEAVAHGDVWALVWARRALAYHHFLEGRTQESYDICRKCLAEAASSGLKRPFYALPWILELLFEYHKRGYEPIPEYDFEKEMETAIEGINIQLRGVAFRIHAKMAEIKGENPAAIQSFLKKSEADLKQVGNPIQLALTRAELALMKLHQGNQKQSLNLALLAWEGLSVYGATSFPKELMPLIQSQDDLPSNRSQNDDIMNRYMEMMEAFIPCADLGELLSRLVAATSRFFEAERGAIFWIDGNSKKQPLVFRTAYNLTKEEVDGEAFRSNMIHVFKAYKNKKSLIARLPQVDHEKTGPDMVTIFCMPFDIRGKVRGVLYYDNRYSKGAFESLEKTLLNRISRNVGSYILRIRDYCQEVEAKSLLALRQSTTNESPVKREIKAQSNIMRELFTRADKAAKSDAPVLILGETGVGKELLARRVHEMSLRRMMPFIAVNISSFPETLVESELFGHEKGAFTGADCQKPGRMELANKGTLFIDELGDIPKSVQVKILRAVEEKSFFRVGGTRNFQSDFRLIAATNLDLVKEVEMGNFREDLYYRLSVVPLIVPPLRERGSDVIYLVQYFLGQFARKFKRPVPELTSEDKARLKAHHWPGNVRELKNVVERAMILSNEGTLDFAIPEAPKISTEASGSFGNPFSDNPTMNELQGRYINYILNATAGKISGPGSAADILGMKRTTLYARMKKLGLA